MTVNRLVLQSVNQVGETVARRIQIGVVYLRRVARENNLRILAGTADNRLYLVRSQILRFVNYYLLTGNAPATDVGNRFQTQLVIVQQILHPLVDTALGRLVFAVRRFAH